MIQSKNNSDINAVPVPNDTETNAMKVNYLDYVRRQKQKGDLTSSKFTFGKSTPTMSDDGRES